MIAVWWSVLQEKGNEVQVVPSTDGMPGAVLFQQLLNWTMMGVLWACVGAFLVGAGLYGWGRHAGMTPSATTGKFMVAGGAVGAIMAGLGPTVINMLFAAARGT